MQVIHAHEKALEHFQQAYARLGSIEEQPHEHLAIREKIGDVAIALGQLDLARDFFQRMESQPIEREARCAETDLYRIRALRKLGKIEEIAGDYPAALRWLRESADMVIRLQDTDDSSCEQLRVLGALAWIQHCTGDHEKALSISAEGLSLLGESDSSAEKAQFLTTIGHASHCRGEFDQAIDYQDRALEIYEGLEDSAGIIRTLNALSGAKLAAGYVDEALELLDQVEQSTSDNGDRAGHAMCMHLHSAALLRCGDLENSLEKVESSVVISGQMNMRFLKNRNHFLRGKIRRRKGDMEGAESDLYRAFGVYSRGGKGSWLLECMMELSWLHIDRKEADKAAEIIENIFRLEGYESNRLLALEVRYLRICIDQLLGKDLESLLDGLKTLEKEARDRSALELRIRLLNCLAEWQVEMRQLEDARQSYRRCDRLHQAFSESLPGPLRPRYLSSQKVVTPLEGGHEVPEVFSAEETELENLQESQGFSDSENPRQAPEPEEEFLSAELVRVSRLLAEAAAMPMPRVLIPKSLSALVRALGGQQGWILTRKGDSIHVACGVDGQGQSLKGFQERIALPLVEEIWNSGKGLTARRIVDEPRTQTLECLYRNGVSSLCVMPLRSEGTIRALVYIADPEGSRIGSVQSKAVLDAHCGLLGLLLPRTQAVPTNS